MTLINILREPEGRVAIDNLARNFNIDRDQAEAAVASVLPQLSEQLERNTLSRGGLADLVGLLGSARHTQPSSATLDPTSPAAIKHGNALLEHILGNKDASRAVAARAAASSGIGATIIQAMLPYIAQMVISSLARKTSGGFGDILSKIPQMGGAGGGANVPLPPSPSGGGFGFPSATRQTGLPGPEGMQLPTGRNPYGDLSDIIRKGGPSAGIGGNPVWNIVRSMLGGIVGFQSRGIVGWLFRLLVMRWGWNLLRTILGRVFRLR